MIYLQSAYAAAFMGSMFFAVAVAGPGISVGDDWTLMPYCGVGAIIGGFAFHFMRPPRAPGFRSIAARWLISTGLSIVTTPALIELLAARWAWQVITPATVMGLSAAMAFCAWGIATFIIRKLNPEILSGILRKLLKS